MVFSEAIFLVLFLPTTLVVYFLIHSLVPKNLLPANIWLLCVSLFFYAWGEPLYIVLMLFSIFVNYFFGIWVAKYPKSKKGKQIVALACVVNLGMLFVFKYLKWILSMVASGYDGRFAHLALPIGISFYTFQALSYVIDVYRKKNDAQKSILTVGLYIAFFPQLIAGPIVKYSTVAEQLNSRTHSFDKFSQGVWRFCTGLVKKVLLANRLAAFSEWCFHNSGYNLTVVMAWMGTIAFALQLYNDFSGYSDMAIGLGKMFGFEFRENFNYPLLSTSMSEYWRRWHISLGEWFREYLFFPLSLGTGMRIRKATFQRFGRVWSERLSSMFVFFVTWMATGIWHGANMTFVCWGFLQFVCLYCEKYMDPFKNHAVLKKTVGYIKTQLICLVSAVLFNAADLSCAGQYFQEMLGLAGNPLIDYRSVYWIGQYGRILLVALVFAFPVVPALDRCFDKISLRPVWNGVKGVVMVVLYLVSLSYAISGGYNPFIYFNF